MKTEKKKSKKRYKCPYCEIRMDKLSLIDHVEKEHNDLIPEDYTAARVVFNYINKKEHGRCRQCGKKTKWNEEKWRYEVFCEDENCIKEYTKLVKSRMVNKYGVEHRLNDPEVQKQMLSKRKISGDYKFKDGGIRSYCGSYERKLLEFYDKVMNVHSRDIMTPGPNIEYEYKGEKHIWITDILYLPANLVHDVKDGGNNPNTREMPEYREKQEAKEEAISKLNKYNYIRLTDNNFQQLLLTLAKIKEQLMDNLDEMIIDINESSITAGCIPAPNPNDVYIVPYLMNNSLIGHGICSNKYMDDLHIIEDDKVKKVSPLFLKDYDYAIFKYNDELNMNDIINIKDVKNFYEAIIQNECLDSKQIFMDNRFTKIVDGYRENEIKMNIRENSLINASNNLIFIEVTDIKERNKKQEIISKYPNLDILETISGYIAINLKTKESSNCSYSSLYDMEEDMLSILNGD